MDEQQFVLCYFERGRIFRDKWICELGYNYEEASRLKTDIYFEEVKKIHHVLPFTSKEEISRELNKNLLKGRVIYTDRKFLGVK